MGVLDQIDHVVVLMLENRSFDSMLGQLYPKSGTFEGLTGNEFNFDAKQQKIAVWNSRNLDSNSMSIPTPDPGELWTDINEQLFGSKTEPVPLPLNGMTGFVTNYESQPTKDGVVYDGKSVMHFYTPEQLIVLSDLARNFAVCDHWYASAPCQTWPNRFFLHTATANGYENNDPFRPPYAMPTIFGRFDECKIGNGWKIYFHDIPQSLTLHELQGRPDRFHFFEQFKADAASGNLPCYSFIEPRYFPDVHLPNDQHPPHNVTLGEQLIAEVYNSVRSGKAWDKTLLIITYDEHGGCYDHVLPPEATQPSAGPYAPFAFHRYGVRVPTVIVSPYIKPGTILRSTGPVPFDHTSIAATLRKRFSLGPSLTERDGNAPDLEMVLNLSTPDNLGPKSLGAHIYVPSPADVARGRDLPLTGMQQGLLELAHSLGGLSVTEVSQPTEDELVKVAEASITGESKIVDTGMPVKDAVNFIKEHLGNFFKQTT